MQSENMNEENSDESILDGICIAMPCSVGWDNMQGDEKVRNCGGCNKSVYNISAMSKKQAEILLSKAELPCLHIVRNSDGSLATDECPEWLKPLRETWKRCVAIAISIIAVLLPTHSAKADQPPAPRDMNMFQTEPTVIDGHPYGGRGRAERLVKPEPVQFSNVPVGTKDWRNRYLSHTWPTSIKRIGIAIDDLPPLDAIGSVSGSGIELAQIKLQSVDLKLLPSSVDTTAFEKLERARKLHAEACLHFAHNMMRQCANACQEAHMAYNAIILEHLDKGVHDPVFRQFVISEYSKLLILQQQCEAYLKEAEKPKP